MLPPLMRLPQSLSVLEQIPNRGHAAERQHQATLILARSDLENVAKTTPLPTESEGLLQTQLYKLQLRTIDRNRPRNNPPRTKHLPNFRQLTKHTNRERQATLTSIKSIISALQKIRRSSESVILRTHLKDTRPILSCDDVHATQDTVIGYGDRLVPTDPFA